MDTVRNLGQYINVYLLGLPYSDLILKKDLFRVNKRGSALKWV